MSPVCLAVLGEQRELLARLRAVVEAKDTEVTVLRAELSAALDRETPAGAADCRTGTPAGHGQQQLGIAVLERADRGEGTPQGRAEEPYAPERERRTDRKRGGQPWHPGSGPSRDRAPHEQATVDPPAESLRGAGRAWPRRRPRGRRGRRSGTCASPGG